MPKTPPTAKQKEEPMTALYTNGAAPFNLNLAVHHPSAAQNRARRRAHRSRRRQRFHDGQHLAVLRAFLAARAYAAGWFTTLVAAAVFAGSNVHYVRAALALLQNGDEALIDHVRRGNVSILAAAKQVQPQVKLIEAYKKATPANREAFYPVADLGEHILYSSAEKRAAAGRVVGVDLIWDGLINPVITTPAE
jgi:hypothetical protein